VGRITDGNVRISNAVRSAEWMRPSTTTRAALRRLQRMVDDSGPRHHEFVPSLRCIRDFSHISGATSGAHRGAAQLLSRPVASPASLE